VTLVSSRRQSGRPVFFVAASNLLIALGYGRQGLQWVTEHQQVSPQWFTVTVSRRFRGCRSGGVGQGGSALPF
jgi:hypothetical protein